MYILIRYLIADLKSICYINSYLLDISVTNFCENKEIIFIALVDSETN